eukprot:UN26171
MILNVKVLFFFFLSVFYLRLLVYYILQKVLEPDPDLLKKHEIILTNSTIENEQQSISLQHYVRSQNLVNLKKNQLMPAYFTPCCKKITLFQWSFFLLLSGP